MGLSHSPSISTDGLVFAYDMGNTQKSWKGAPATNLLINSVIPFANIYNFPDSTGTITQNYRQAPDGTNTAQQLSSTGTGLGTQFFTNVVTSTPSGTVYTFSFYTLSSSQTGWVIGGVGINQCTINSTTNVLLPNGWYRWVVVVTTNTNNAIIALMAQVSIGTTIIVWGGQIELGGFATPLIPTISAIASRSNTQAIVDLTNNNIITASNLTYASDNTFSFNGGQHMSIPNNALFNMTSGLTIESWVKFDGNSDDFIFEKGDVNTQYSLFSHSSDIVFRTYHSGDGAYHTQSPLKSDVGISNGVWVHIVGSWDGSYKRIFVNGQLKNEVAKSGTLVTTSKGSSVGRFGGDTTGYYFNGSISKVAIYNRGLSAVEVRQNFNALRGRYGI